MGKKEEPKEIPIEFVYDTEELKAQEAASANTADEDVPANESSKPDATHQVQGPDLQAQVDTLTQEKAALYDQLLRRQAEFENYRRRIDREKVESYARARGEVLHPHESRTIAAR